jgi:hypothetical protein
MKKVLFVFFLFVPAVMAQADDYAYPYLTMEKTDGATASFSVNDLKITFDSGTLKLVNVSTSESYTLTELSKMYFAKTSTGIADVMADTDDSEVEVFTVSGIDMGKYENVNTAKTKLTRGVYVVKSKNGKLQKIAVK